MTRVKICGMTQKDHALAAARGGADFIGLVFAPSTRRVTPEQAAEIATAVKKSGCPAQLVGVFVNTADYEVNRIAGLCRLDWVQLNGDESWDYCNGLERPVIKALRIGGETAEAVRETLAEGEAKLKVKHIYLLDSQVKGRYGGTGTAFDWKLARLAAADFPVVMAGGLTPDNVGQAIGAVAPWGVDVSSGVETNGVKDPAKIEQFIKVVRQADGNP